MTISDIFRINGISNLIEEIKILDILNINYPSNLWNCIHLTSIQEATIKVHGYIIAEPSNYEETKNVNCN